LPALLDGLARHEKVALPVRVQGATSADGDYAIRFDPAEYASPGQPPPPRPRFNAIIASVDLAVALAANPATCPDGFVVEGYTAGGHNAPPRGPRHLDASAQPVYDDRDVVDPRQMAEVGLPFWMAGSYGTPDGLARARAGGATGIQVGTAFAFCRESGMTADLKRRVLDLAAHGEVPVRTDPRASPTGFPFKVVALPGTLADDEVYADRQRLCDLSALRTPFRKDDGTLAFRCPAEPVTVYEGHGGRPANTDGRRCLCNGLMATAGLAQRRARGYVEPAVVTAGTDFTGVRHLLRQLPAGQETYSAADVVAYLLGEDQVD
jgi:NAD(P)H-dependent flavin oxidoreductase YrpB (nitropropane dioxygenase family)